MKKLYSLLILLFISSPLAQAADNYKSYWQCSCYSRYYIQPQMTFTINEDEAEFAYEAEFIAQNSCEPIVEKLNKVTCEKLFDVIGNQF